MAWPESYLAVRFSQYEVTGKKLDIVGSLYIHLSVYRNSLLPMTIPDSKLARLEIGVLTYS
jgi:hypothetical protein